MPSDNQKGFLPRSSVPGRPLLYVWPLETLPILWGATQPAFLDLYVEPAADRVGRGISMPSSVRLNYNREGQS